MNRLQDAALQNAVTPLLPQWQVVQQEGRPPFLERCFTFADFAEALTFTNAVGQVAEAMNHHPDITLSWGKVVVAIHTHTAGGITTLDIEFAKRLESLS